MLDKKLPFEFVFETLKKISCLFTPPLSESLDIKVYARKLSEKADFTVCMLADELLGFTAYYLNSAVHQIYVTLICVDTNYQENGLGSKMLAHITARVKSVDKHYTTIALEVNRRNGKAHRFYLKQGFKEQENRGEKILMVKAI